MKLICQWCGNSHFKNKMQLTEHENICEWKEKILNWNQMVKENKDKLMWYVDSHDFVIKKCVLSSHYNMIRLCKEDETYENCSRSYGSENLFNTKKDAQIRLNYLNKIYLETFKYKPFLSESIITENFDKLLYIEKSIGDQLLEYPNFEGIDFCNVNAGGIQIRGHHVKIKGYTYGNQPTIKYNFANYKEVVNEFIDMWKRYDTLDNIREEQNFIYEGEKYGWD